MNYVAITNFGTANNLSGQALVNALNAVARTSITSIPINGPTGIKVLMLTTASTVVGHGPSIWADVAAAAAVTPATAKSQWASDLLAFINSNISTGLNLSNSIDTARFAGLQINGILNASDVANAQLVTGYTNYQYIISGVFNDGSTPQTIALSDVNNAAVVGPQIIALKALTLQLLQFFNPATSNVNSLISQANSGQSVSVPTFAQLVSLYGS